MYYQTLLKGLAPELNPAGVEASMRLNYGTLNHLPRETFVEEARLAVIWSASRRASCAASPTAWAWAANSPSGRPEP